MLEDAAKVASGATRFAKNPTTHGSMRRGDDFIGVQNYERHVWAAEGRLPVPADAERTMFGGGVYPGSLAGAVRYAHQRSGAPVIVTDYGAATDKDDIRARMIPAALAELKRRWTRAHQRLGPLGLADGPWLSGKLHGRDMGGAGGDVEEMCPRWTQDGR